MKKCRFCGQEREKLIKAHIIPKWAYESYDAKKERKFEHLSPDSRNKVKPNQTQTGYWDRSILCKECDNEFAPYEQLAKKFLLSDLDGYRNQKGYYVILSYHYDYNKLKKFFVSILWRASISSHSFFSKIDLGKKYNQQALYFLKGDLKDSDSLFPIILQKWSKSNELKSGQSHKFIQQPYKDKIELIDKSKYINCCIFNFAGYKILIKVDRQELREVFSKEMTLNNKEWHIKEINFDNSSELGAMASAISNKQKK